jgi:hypothetical protein
MANIRNIATRKRARQPSLQLALPCGCRVQRPGPTDGLDGLFLNPLQEVRARRDIVNQTNDLAGGPYLQINSVSLWNPGVKNKGCERQAEKRE